MYPGLEVVLNYFQIIPMKVNQQNTPFNILLADDDKDDCFFFEKALKEIQIATHIETVNDGEQLMDYLLENSVKLPDVLFLDLNMPRKNGFECLLEINERTQLKDIFIVMFSTSYPRDPNYENDMINRLLKFGANHFIRKPDDFEELKKVIKHALGMAIEYRAQNRQEEKLC